MYTMRFTALLLCAVLGHVRGKISAVVNTPGGGYSYRVQALSTTVVRVERSLQVSTASFEDRPTFLAVNRSWPGLEVRTSGGGKRPSEAHSPTPRATTLRKMIEKPLVSAAVKLEQTEATIESSRGRNRRRSRAEQRCSLTSNHAARTVALHPP